VLSLALTLATEDIYRAFYSDDINQTFFTVIRMEISLAPLGLLVSLELLEQTLSL